MNSKEVVEKNRRAEVLLGLGTVIGLALALASLMAPSADDVALSEDVVARVNGVAIPRGNYLRAVAALASDRRNPLDASDRRHVLDRLIDEELLVQHGLALGLAISDRRVRADLVSAVMGAFVASSDGFDPSLTELAKFYVDNLDYFTRSGRVRVREIFIGTGGRRSEDDALEIALQISKRLDSGEDFTSVQRELGDTQIARIPEAMLPPSKLRNYLGPTAAQAAGGLEIGEISAPILSAQGYHILWIVDREPPVVPPFEEISSEVRSEMKRRQSDRDVRESLASLRVTSNVIVVESLP